MPVKGLKPRYSSQTYLLQSETVKWLLICNHSVNIGEMIDFGNVHDAVKPIKTSSSLGGWISNGLYAEYFSIYN